MQFTQRMTNTTTIDNKYYDLIKLLMRVRLIPVLQWSEVFIKTILFNIINIVVNKTSHESHLHGWIYFIEHKFGRIAMTI